MKLIDEIGFDAVDVGTIDESPRQQPGASVSTKEYDAAGLRRALSEAILERTNYWRATGIGIALVSLTAVLIALQFSANPRVEENRIKVPVRIGLRKSILRHGYITVFELVKAFS